MTYTHSDAPGFERGDMGKNKPKVARIYAIDANRSDDKITYVKSYGACGQLYEESFPSNTIVKLKTPIVR